MSNSKKTVHTAPCRYCGQVIQIDEENLTEEQAIEAASMRCSCARASYHQRIMRRRETALNNIATLFAREGDEIQSILKQAVDNILDESMEKVTLNLKGGIKAVVSQNSKGEINVERTVTSKTKLSE